MLFFKKNFLFYVSGYYIIKAEDESEAVYKLCYHFTRRKLPYCEIIKNYTTIK